MQCFLHFLLLVVEIKASMKTMDKDEMEAYLDFSLMAERNQTQVINLNQIDKQNTEDTDNNLKQEWSDASELTTNSTLSQGQDLTSEYLITKSSQNVQFLQNDNFLLVSEMQRNQETKGTDLGTTKTDTGNLHRHGNHTKSFKDSDIFSKIVNNSQGFVREEEDVSDGHVTYYPWNYNDEIVVLNLSRGEKDQSEPAPGTSNSSENIVVQFENDLQSETEMHFNFIQKKKNEFQCDDKNVGSDTKQTISKLSGTLGDSNFCKGDNKYFPGGEMVRSTPVSDVLDQKKKDNSDEACDFNNYSDEDISQMKSGKDMDVEPNIYITKKRKVEMQVSKLSGSHFDLSGSQHVKSGRMKASQKMKSPIKMTFKKRKFEVQDLCGRNDSTGTLGEAGIQEEKCCIEKATTSNDCDYENINDAEENVPLDYSMHATLVRQNLSKSGMNDQISSKHLSDTDATTSDQDQESFCSSLRLVSVSEMEQKKSSDSQRKYENERSAADDLGESDTKEEESEQKEIGQVDKFVLERLIKSCQEKKKLKSKTTESNNSKEKIFNCDTCSKTFTRRSTWRHHIKIHVDDKFKECKICGKKLKFSGNMLSHLKTHTGDRPFKCEFCEKTFTRAASLYTHVRSHTGEKAFLCEICGKGFADKSHYRRHLRIHSGIKPFKCEVCEMAFTQSWSLKSHMLCHAEEKPHICSFCGKGYTQKAYLESHIRSHTGERPYSCETCGKSFSDSSCMRRHAKSHLGERSFICELCGKAFGRGWNLTVHMRIHYDDKRYECYICGKAFVQKINLDKHILTHPVEPCD
ncbi:zinc finger protein 28-like [Ylistrum balloti]|uniref:zinc finger protein 28-like n=1 Tax=Ylistrum balloti TaxID=509963 RepID=UPI002905D525|nr:zinc finger protein 28-like [Ylistrum balloti]